MARTSARARAMIRWLADKDPDVWFATTRLLNWDNALPVLKWIVAQPRCDKANAARIFWACSPGYLSCRLAEGDQPRSELWPLAQAVLANWSSGFYLRSELAWPDAEGRAAMDHFERETAVRPGARDALGIPPDLFGPLAGRAPHVPALLTPVQNAELWDLLNGLGSRVGHRPGSDGWRTEQEARAARDEADAARRRQRLAGVFWLGISVLLLVVAVVIGLRR